jgi:hypothetical protein
MPTKIPSDLVQRVGEHLVCAELCRLELTATTFSGNLPDFDILAVDAQGKSKRVQVKTIQSGSWQFNASKFLEISISENGIQTVGGYKRSNIEDIIFVFVKLISRGKDRFYVVSSDELFKIMKANYENWLNKHGGRRPKRPDSKHAAIAEDDLSAYLDNWELLTV